MLQIHIVDLWQPYRRAGRHSGANVGGEAFAGYGPRGASQKIKIEWPGKVLNVVSRTIYLVSISKIFVACRHGSL